MYKKVAIVLWLVVGIVLPSWVLISAIDEMYSITQDAKAIARIYTREGCTVSDQVLTKEPNTFVLECGGALYKIKLR